MTFKKLISLLTLLCLLPVMAIAGVNLKNGNFYISYTDLNVPGGGKKLDITRTYNSRATETGWFGFGWGSDYETKLELSADGSVVIHENGSGGKTRFTPQSKVDAEAAAKKIVEAMRKRTQLNEATAKQLVAKLKNNAELRHDYAVNFKVQTSLSKGTKLYSSERGKQSMTVLADGYKREYSDGRYEIFNKDGNLVKQGDKSGYFVALEWKGKKLEHLKDSQGKQIYFDWFASGRVKAVWSAGDDKVEYKYDDKGNLIYSKDVQNNVYKFAYDASHNMTQITYSDKSTMKVDYEKKTLFVEKITSRTGEETKYVYGSDDKAPEDHYWTEVTKKGFNGKAISNKYEYEIKTRPDGSRYTYRIVTEINGIKTETIYSECCSLPLKIARGKHVTNFEYNSKGLLTKKSSTKGDFVNIEYEKGIDKIKKVTNNQGWTEFSYDKKGNLRTAKNNQGKAVLLVYDLKGKITKMVDKDQKSKKTRTLAFKYNAVGKPIEIEIEKVGKINVAYDNYGEIKKVESSAGHKMAMQVTRAFQNLLGIVKPAGVNLGI